jgi:hypothetical protein
MMRRVAIAGGEVEEEGFVGGGRVLRADPVDRAIGQVVNQDVIGISKGRQDRRVVLEQRRVPLYAGNPLMRVKK